MSTIRGAVAPSRGIVFCCNFTTSLFQQSPLNQPPHMGMSFWVDDNSSEKWHATTSVHYSTARTVSPSTDASESCQQHLSKL